MKNALITLLGKSTSLVSRLTNKGAGGTWPGHIALKLQPTYIQDVLKNSPTQVILIIGTNGKTTTGRMLTTILERNRKIVIQNSSGANLLNGVASSLLLHTNFFNRITADYAIFEVDENNLSLVLRELTPKAIIVLDLFRDQLDRYGELDAIAAKWRNAFAHLPSTTQLILNADDPLVAYLGQDTKATLSYFGLNQATEEGTALQHAADSLYCPRCSTKLAFKKIFYSHLGQWRCPQCKLQRPLPNLAESYYPLEGTYNRYNTLAAHLCARSLGISEENITTALHTVSPAFGRQEKLSVDGKKIQLFLAKNPTGFNESLRTIHEKKAKHVAFILNDRIPDGQDVSWIWDIDFEPYIDTFQTMTISGDRAYDMALRVAYAAKTQKFSHYTTEPTLKTALQLAVRETPPDETLYILPTYSAMLEVRKILTGRKIL